MTDTESAIVLQTIGQVCEDMFGQALHNKYQAQPTEEDGLTCFNIDIPEAPKVTLKLFARDDIKPWDSVAWNTFADWIGVNGYAEDIVGDKISVYNPTEEEFKSAFDGSSQQVNTLIDRILKFAMENGVTSEIYGKVDNPKGFLNNTFQKMAGSYFEIFEGDDLFARFRLLRFTRSRSLPLTPAPLVFLGTAMMALAYLGDPENKEVLQDVMKHLDEILE